MSRKPTRIKVWLLHGTWARAARWTKDGSTLRTALQRDLPGDVEFIAMPWTGNNRMDDRWKAASQLAQAVRENAAPDDRVFVVAHSHGGNVAALASEAEIVDAWQEGRKARARLFDGIITLNTPFLGFVPRDRFAVLMHALFLGVAANVLLPWSPVVTFIGAAAWIGLIVLVGHFASPWILGFIRGISEPMLHDPKETRTPMLALTSAEDEASGWLELFDVLLNVPYLLFHKIAFWLVLLGVTIAHVVFRWDFAGLTELAAAVEAGREHADLWGHFMGRYPPPAPETVHAISELFYEQASWSGLLLLLVPSVVSYIMKTWAVLALGSLALSYIVRAFAFGSGFNFRSLLMVFFLRLKVTLVPLFGFHAAIAVIPSRGSALLRHSDIYANDAALQVITDWIGGVVATRRSPTSSRSKRCPEA